MDTSFQGMNVLQIGLTFIQFKVLPMCQVHTPGKAPQLTDRQAAPLSAMACSAAPAGHEHGTLRRLADHGVALSQADRCRYETRRQLLKKPPQTLVEAGRVHSRAVFGWGGRPGRRPGALRSPL
jgi:hypothetical protein